MFCSKCGNRNSKDERFCRRCGTDLQNLSLTPFEKNLASPKMVSDSSPQVKAKDPDELTSNGIGSVIMGDGFFMVAVILSASDSSVSSLLWLFLLIPAFFFFGKGFADVLHARQIQRRLKQNKLSDGPKIGELLQPRTSVVDVLKKSISGELAAVPSVTERTTRDLK